MARRRRPVVAELVRRGLAPGDDAAAQLVAAGRVTVGGAPVHSPSRQVGPGEAVVVLAPPARYASRAGEKLAGALDALALDVAGRRAVDVGASTGGFTDCLLDHGAAHVVALDVGHGHLLPRLRDDPRVAVVERCNVRGLADVAGGAERRAEVVGAPAEVVTADVSFTSLAGLAPALWDLTAPGGDLLVLVKPQFEADRPTVSRGHGVVADPDVWARALDRVATAFADLGGRVVGAAPSPLRGAKGNVELFLHVHRPLAAGPGVVEVDLGAAVAAAGRVVDGGGTAEGVER